MNHALREGSNFKVLLCSRSDPEDFKLKGFDIAAKAFACIELREPSYLLIFVGALKGALVLLHLRLSPQVFLFFWAKIQALLKP